jgi:nucleotide-binding universal stress UspA family protein
MKILLAVDGSKNSLNAVDCVIEHADWYRSKPEVELVYVHLPVPKLPRMGIVVGKSQIERYYEEEGQGALAAAKKKLSAAGVRFKPRVLVGPIAETLVAHAKRQACDLICIGTHGRTETGKFLLGSVATKVSHLATTPVLLVR